MNKGFNNIREDDTTRPQGIGMPALAGSGTTNSSPGFLSGIDFGGIANGFFTNLSNNLGANLGAPKTGMAGDVKAVCGNKPLNLGPLNKGKREAYETCAQTYASNVLAAQTAAANAAAAAANAPKGLSTGAIIGIAGTMLVLTGVTIYLAVRK